MISLTSSSYDLHQLWVCGGVLRGFIRRASKFKRGLPKRSKDADTSDPSCSLGVAQGGRWQSPLGYKAPASRSERCFSESGPHHTRSAPDLPRLPPFISMFTAALGLA